MAITMNNFGHKAISALVAMQGYNDESCGPGMQNYNCMYLMKKQPGFTYKRKISQVYGFGAKDNMVKKFNWARVNMLQTDN